LGNLSQVSSPILSRSAYREIDTMLKAGAANGRARLQRSIERIRRIHPDLSERSILRRTAELKLTSWNRPWTEEDKDFVLERAREFPVTDIAKRLGRTPKAVYQLLWKRGESAKFQDGYTQRDLAETLHVSPRKVRQWVRLGWLLLYEGRVKDRSLQRFLQEHSNEIDGGRLETDVKLWLGDLGFRPDPSLPPQSFAKRKHSLMLHVCNRCGRKIYGNSIHRHRKACARPTSASIAVAGSGAY